jgi:hypothetical protein
MTEKKIPTICIYLFINAYRLLQQNHKEKFDAMTIYTQDLVAKKISEKLNVYDKEIIKSIEK